MKNFSFAVVFLFFLPFAAQAQISHPGVPGSFSLKTELSAVPFEKMPEVDVVMLRQEDLVLDTIRDIPWRFGENIPVDLNPGNSGVWDILENGDKIWRLGIQSPGAYSINLTFDKYRLPPGAELYVYNIDTSFVIGAFTDYNNQDDGYFATTLLPGDAVVIEYIEPSRVNFPGELNLELVTHAYRNPMDFTLGFGDSGWCNLNVACDEADGWEDQINSVVMMVTGSSGFCSGVLINNANNDATPFVLSANHCYRNPSTVVVWFNWQSETCSNPPSSPPNDAMSGAMQRARHASSDFWLMELNQPVPEEYNPYFAGWNRTMESTLNDTIIGIHHPRGDIKKFSYAEGGVQAASYLGSPGSGTSHWHIIWSGGTTTEPGSSGSPIFDAQGRILGQLHGGYAACGNTLPDWYGRFGLSWNGGGTNSTRLSTWLDPDGTDPVAIPGFDPFGEIIDPPDNFAAQPVDSETISLTWELNPMQQPVMIAVNSENTFGIPSGPYTLGEEISDGGTVIYLGDDQEMLHPSLDYATTYYYKTWSYSNVLNYSAGISDSAATPCPVFSEFPFEEVFDEGEIPSCWWQEFVSGEVMWQVGSGNDAGNPDAPYTGDYNVFFKSPGTNGNGESTKLITPFLDFGDFDFGELTFFYANAAEGNHQDVLRVYYRLAEDLAWEILDTFDQDTPIWTEAMIALPEVSAEYQIAFEAQSNGGHGVALDAISISGYYDTEFPAPANLVAQLEGNTVDLEWDAPDLNENGPVFSGYQIHRNDNLIAFLENSDNTLFTDTGLAIGVYDYFVSALYHSPGGLSDPTNLVTVEVLPDPVLFTLTIETMGEGTTLPEPGSHQYNEGSQAQLEAFAGDHHSFSHWLENDTVVSDDASIFLEMFQDRTLTAVFDIDQHEVTLSTHPEGITEPSGDGLYDHGDVAEISTDVPYGYHFVSWKEDGVVISTSPVFQITVTRDRHLAANFQLKNFEVILAVDPEEAGIAEGEGVYPYGGEATIMAIPAPGWEFVRWEENGESVSEENPFVFEVFSDRGLLALMDIQILQLEIVIEGQGTTQPPEGTYQYAYGEEVSLEGIPDEGWFFVKWEINGESYDEAQQEIVLEEEVNAKAIFEPSTGVGLVKDQEKLSIYPVPASGSLTVGFGSLNGDFTLEVFNLSGQRLIFHQDHAAAPGHEMVLNVGHLNSGVYLLKVSDGRDRILFEKIVVR